MTREQRWWVPERRSIMKSNNRTSQLKSTSVRLVQVATSIRQFMRACAPACALHAPGRPGSGKSAGSKGSAAGKNGGQTKEKADGAGGKAGKKGAAGAKAGGAGGAQVRMRGHMRR